MADSDYPKWVQREEDIGAVLCLDADEEKQLLADWKAEKRRKAKAEAAQPEAVAQE